MKHSILNGMFISPQGLEINYKTKVSNISEEFLFFLAKVASVAAEEVDKQIKKEKCLYFSS